jgi:hypothetical protein
VGLKATIRQIIPSPLYEVASRALRRVVPRRHVVEAWITKRSDRRPRIEIGRCNMFLLPWRNELASDAPLWIRFAALMIGKIPKLGLWSGWVVYGEA